MSYSIKPFEELEFTDDFVFTCVLREDPELCRELLEMILDRKIREIRNLELEHTVKTTIGGKGIRLDVFAEEPGVAAFDLEMQVLADPMIEKRSRYYHSAMDTDLLRRGEKYGKLPDSFVIFICKNGIGEGYLEPVYHFVMMDPGNLSGNIFGTLPGETKSGEGMSADEKDGQFGRDMVEIKKEDTTRRGMTYLNDGVHTIFLNAAGNLEHCGGKLKNFLTYVRNAEIPVVDGEADDFTRRIDESVERLLTRQNMRGEYMTYEMKIQEEKEASFEEGLREGREEGLLGAVTLFEALHSAGRGDELLEASKDKDKLKKLMEEFGIV